MLLSRWVSARTLNSGRNGEDDAPGRDSKSQVRQRDERTGCVQRSFDRYFAGREYNAGAFDQLPPRINVRHKKDHRTRPGR